MKFKLLLAVFLSFVMFIVAQPALALLTTADVMFVVDESGSMAGEHAWIGGMVTNLDTALIGKGLTGNQYALVGFGTSQHGGGASGIPHKHLVGGGDWGTAAQLTAATSSLVTIGSLEDGWRGITYGLTNYTFRPGAGRNVILITDEDRDNTNSAITYATTLALLTGNQALLNAVVNAAFGPSGSTVLGVDSEGNAYIADGTGGYIKVAGGTALSGLGSTITDYVNLAWATGGAAWDLNQLRAGGNTAKSFNAAFVDIKVQEIQQQQPIPEPATMFLLGSGLIGLAGLARRRMKK